MGTDAMLGPNAWFSGPANPGWLKLNLTLSSQIGAGLKADYKVGLPLEGTGGLPGVPAKFFTFLSQLRSPMLPKRKYMVPGFRPLCEYINPRYRKRKYII